MHLNFVGHLCIFCVIVISFCKFSLIVAPNALRLEDLLGYNVNGDLVDGCAAQFASISFYPHRHCFDIHIRGNLDSKFCALGKHF